MYIRLSTPVVLIHLPLHLNNAYIPPPPPHSEYTRPDSHLRTAHSHGGHSAAHATSVSPPLLPTQDAPATRCPRTSPRPRQASLKHILASVIRDTAQRT